MKVNTTNPEADYYVKYKKAKQFVYSLHSCVDKKGFIINQHVTHGNVYDSIQLKPMVENLLSIWWIILVAMLSPIFALIF